jgi:hypothetical protein
MTIWWLLFILSLISAMGSGFLWLALHLHAGGKPDRAIVDDYEGKAREDVERIFNDEFREELRNRGRLHFEKILGENAMFLQQDLRLTTSQLNDYMKNEISKDLKDAFANYESAISDARQLAVESIDKTKQAIDEERKTLGDQLEKEIIEEKNRRVARFDEHMAGVVNHYVLAAVGDQIDLSDQLEYVLGELDANKQAILEDIKSGS